MGNVIDGTENDPPKDEVKAYPRRHALPVDEAQVAPIRARVAALETELARAQEAARVAVAERDALLSSVSWRAMAPVRRITGLLRRQRTSPPAAPPPPAPEPAPGTNYDRWLHDHHSLSEADRAAIKAHLGRLAEQPLISILMIGGLADTPLMQATLTSIKAQLYPHWEIGHAPDGQIGQAIASAKGDFLALMAPGDRLAEEALYEVAVALNDQPGTDLVYTDEDCLDEAGHRFAPAFKPDWNIDLLLGQNLVGRLAAYRRSVLAEAIAARGDGGDGMEEHDLALVVAAASQASQIRHIPTVLYHRYAPEQDRALFAHARPPAWTAPRRAAVETYLAGKAEVVTWPGDPPRLQIRRPLPNPPPRVSLILPTRDNPALLARCAAGLLHRTDYPDIELVIVDNDSRDAETLGLLSRLQQDRRVRVLSYRAPFNYAAINNWAVDQTSGEVLVLINDDIDVIDGGWLREMVSVALCPDIGAVGAKLLYGDGLIQHAGVILGVGEHQGRGGIAGHFGHGSAGDDPGYLDQYALTREVSAVTAACMALRREVFATVGGFDAVHLPIAYNDVDLCLRIRAHGWRIVWTPFAELFHLESQSRGRDVTPEQLARAAGEAAYMRDRWDSQLNSDPFYNPNFDWLYPMQRLAAPPRRIRPWRREARSAEASLSGQ